MCSMIATYKSMSKLVLRLKYCNFSLILEVKAEKNPNFSLNVRNLG